VRGGDDTTAGDVPYAFAEQDAGDVDAEMSSASAPPSPSLRASLAAAPSAVPGGERVLCIYKVSARYAARAFVVRSFLLRSLILFRSLYSSVVRFSALFLFLFLFPPLSARVSKVGDDLRQDCLVMQLLQVRCSFLLCLGHFFCCVISFVSLLTSAHLCRSSTRTGWPAASTFR
jgi:hypothetical protein